MDEAQMSGVQRLPLKFPQTTDSALFLAGRTIKWIA
jgi:hypothetical protein